MKNRVGVIIVEKYGANDVGNWEMNIGQRLSCWKKKLRNYTRNGGNSVRMRKLKKLDESLESGYNVGIV
jgi:hypothetical protein